MPTRCPFRTALHAYAIIAYDERLSYLTTYVRYVGIASPSTFDLRKGPD